MASAEWGPKNAPKENRQLREVTRFHGSQLQRIEDLVTAYLQSNPEASREGAVIFLSENNKHFDRMQLGLDVLNQLGVVDRRAEDVRSIIIREDLSHLVQNAAGEKTARAGEGKPFYWYEIDWVREPDERPAKAPVPSPKRQVIYPFRTAAQRAEGRAIPQRPRFEFPREAQRRGTEQERIRAERKLIEEVVIDRGRELGELSIKIDMIRFELGEDNAVRIGYNSWRRRNDDGSLLYVPIDRETGVYQESMGTAVLRDDLLRFLNAKAQVLEGKTAEYQPNPVTLERLESTYQMAIANETIIINRDLDPQEIVFQYLSDDGVFPDYYGDIDLERGVVESRRNQDRPLHPSFLDFLRQKKPKLKKDPLLDNLIEL